MGAKFHGDWDSASKMRQRIERNGRQFGASISKYAAETYVNVVKDMIHTQDSGTEGRRWVISSAWIREKAKLNPDNQNKAWIASGQFLSQLRVVEISRGVFFGGASAKDHYADSDLTVAQIAAFGEYGTSHTEPKPLFGPARLKTLDKILPTLHKRTEKFITRDTYTE